MKTAIIEEAKPLLRSPGGWFFVSNAVLYTQTSAARVVWCGESCASNNVQCRPASFGNVIAP